MWSYGIQRYRTGNRIMQAWDNMGGYSQEYHFDHNMSHFYKRMVPLYAVLPHRLLPPSHVGSLHWLLF